VSSDKYQQEVLPVYRPIRCCFILYLPAPPQLSCPEFVTVAEEETEAEIVCNISSNTLPDVSEISWRTPAGNIGGQMELVVEGLTSSVRSSACLLYMSCVL